MIARACSLAWASIRLVAPTRAMPTRSLPSRNLAIVPAAVLLADEVLRRDADVLEEDLVDLEAAVDQLDRAQRDAGGVHREDQHRDAALLLLRGRVGAAQAEDPVGVLAERRPGLLAVDHPVVAVADGGGAQRGQVGAGVGLGEALAPPDVEVGRLRQEALLLLLVAEGRDDRADHAGVEGERLRHAGQLHLLAPDVALQRRPVLAAPLHRPVRHGQPGGVEHALGLDVLLLGDVPVGRDRVADLLRHLRGEEGPHLLPEGLELRGQLQPHRSSFPDGGSPQGPAVSTSSSDDPTSATGR